VAGARGGSDRPSCPARARRTGSTGGARWSCCRSARCIALDIPASPSTRRPAAQARLRERQPGRGLRALGGAPRWCAALAGRAAGRSLALRHPDASPDRAGGPERPWHRPAVAVRVCGRSRPTPAPARPLSLGALALPITPLRRAASAAGRHPSAVIPPWCGASATARAVRGALTAGAGRLVRDRPSMTMRLWWSARRGIWGAAIAWCRRATRRSSGGSRPLGGPLLPGCRAPAWSSAPRRSPTCSGTSQGSESPFTGTSNRISPMREPTRRTSSPDRAVDPHLRIRSRARRPSDRRLAGRSSGAQLRKPAARRYSTALGTALLVPRAVTIAPRRA